MQPRWFSSSPDLILFVLQDILDEMRKELSKLKEELIDGKAHTAVLLQNVQQNHHMLDCTPKPHFFFSLNMKI